MADGAFDEVAGSVSGDLARDEDLAVGADGLGLGRRVEVNCCVLDSWVLKCMGTGFWFWTFGFGSGVRCRTYVGAGSYSRSID